MTSEIQQLLETLMDYSMQEQEEFLEIIHRLNNIVKNIPEREEDLTRWSFKQRGAGKNKNGNKRLQ